ncbi:hypothetical protein EJB05_25188, partial [Eragrostis curvula]
SYLLPLSRGRTQTNTTLSQRVVMGTTNKKAYIVAITVQLIYTGLAVTSKAAFDGGMSTFVFVFYRQAIGALVLLPLALLLHRINMWAMPPFMLLLKLFSCALAGNTLSLNLFNVGLKLTSATVGSATGNTLPVITFCLALLLRMETVKLKSTSGIAKITGAALCLTGVLVIAFYTGPAISPVNHHRAFAAHVALDGSHAIHSKAIWIVGTFLMVLSSMAWCISIVWQKSDESNITSRQRCSRSARTECWWPRHCVFSAVQSFIIALVAERDLSRRRLHPDVSLLAIIYAGIVVTGVPYYLQAWCVEMKGTVFFAVWTPLYFVLTIFCSSFFLGEIVHLGSVVGGILLIGSLYSVLWGKSMESKLAPHNEVDMMVREQDQQMHNKSDEYETGEVTSV